MNRNLNSPTKLTEFARDFEGEPETLFSKFVNRITNVYNTGYNTVNFGIPTTPSSQQTTPTTTNQPNFENIHEDVLIENDSLMQQSVSSSETPSLSSGSMISNQQQSDKLSTITNLSDNPSNMVEKSIEKKKPVDLSLATKNINQLEERSPTNVLQRITNLMAMQKTNLGSYKDTEHQLFWMPDAKSKECYECSQKFSTFRRKHHCRLCGQIFCSKCCNQVVPGKIINCSGDLKVCTYCSNIVLTYLKSADINSDLKSDLKALKDDLSNKLQAATNGGGGGSGAGASSACSSSDGGGGGGGAGGSTDPNNRYNQNQHSNHHHHNHQALQHQQSHRKISIGYQEERLVSQPKLSNPGTDGRGGGGAVDDDDEDDDEENKSKQTTKSGLSNADRKIILQQSNSLKLIHEEMSKALPYQNRGDQLLKYLINHQKSSNEIQAIAILNALIDAGYLILINGSFGGSGQQQFPYHSSSPKQHKRSSSIVSTRPPLSQQQQQQRSDDELDDNIIFEFHEQSFYKLLRLDDVMSHSSSFQLDLDLEANSVHLSRGSGFIIADTSGNGGGGTEFLPPSSQDNSFGFTTSKDFELQNSLLSTVGSQPLMQAFCEHEDLLLTQLLRSEFLPESWSKTLMPLCARIANSIRPELCGMMDMLDMTETRNLMDIRNFVNFKKVPGGQRNESKIVGGVIFSKNVVHKEMSTFIKNPKVLLLKCAIVFQRVEGRFVSIETLLLQEHEYLRNVTKRILNLKPNVVVVHKNVSGIAQDMLRNHGITLVIDVKQTVLDRLARCLNCDIVNSIDSNVGQPKLGRCDRFYIQNFDNNPADNGNVGGYGKTLMFFEVQSSPGGNSVLLRGGSYTELIKVKRVAQMLLFARYNWRLELSFLLDEFARPPSPKPSIFGSKDNSPLRNPQDIDNDGDDGGGGDNKIETITEASKINCSNISSTESTPTPPPPPPPQPPPQPQPQPPKIKSKSELVTKENVQDFSDPLRATDLSPSSFNPETSVEFAVEMPYDNRFRTALSSTVLSISPFIAFPLPFLETEQGRKCALRTYYPNELYYSKQWSTESSGTNVANIQLQEKLIDTAASQSITNICLNETHSFLKHNITTAIDNKEMQTLLANFRACGGRFPKTFTMNKILRKPSAIAATLSDTTKAMVNMNMDALDLNNHQRLPILFCSYYANPKETCSAFCVPPSLLYMKFYGAQDIMLGKFLEYYCFRKSYMCSSCHLPMINHIRRYVHSMGCIQVQLVEDSSVQNSEQILITSWCSLCNQMTPSVAMSKDTWCLSFAKYLEHRFHSHAYKRRVVDHNQIDTLKNYSTNEIQSAEKTKQPQCCTHSMHKDHIQFFSYNGIVARFAYTAISVWEISLPAPILILNRRQASVDGIDKSRICEDIKQFSQIGYDVYAKIYDKLALFSSEVEFPMLNGLKISLNRDQLLFREKVGICQTLLTEQLINLYDIEDAMLVVKKLLADNIELWNHKLQEADNQSRICLAIRQESSGSLMGSGGGGGGGSSSTGSPIILAVGSVQPTMGHPSPVPPPPQQQQQQQQPIDCGTICTEDLMPESPLGPQPRNLALQSTSTAVNLDGISSSNDEIINIDDNFQTNEPESTLQKVQSQLNIPISTAETILTPIKDSMTTQSDKKSVKSRLMELLPSDKPLYTAVPSPLPATEHYNLTIGQFPVLVHDQDLSSVIAYNLVSMDYKKALDNMYTDYSATIKPTTTTITTTNTGGSGGGSLSTVISSAMLNQNTPSPNIKRKSQDGIIDLPSNSGNISDDKDTLFNTPSNLIPSSLANVSTTPIIGTSSATVNDSATKKTNNGNGHGKSYIETYFQDLTTQFTCKTYFAREFDQMRLNFIKPEKKIQTKDNSGLQFSCGLGPTGGETFDTPKTTYQRNQSQPEILLSSNTANTNNPTASSGGLTKEQQDIEEIRCLFARSLCSSVQWKARGGKSGSKFCKTLDDRFVLKEMNKTDVGIFENFAPNYFDYINQCQENDQPTLLAKIFGIFKVTIKKKEKKDYVLYEKSLLIMENLFYNCEIKNKFDLKGSDRNRLVDPTNLNGEIVLLDENLIQMSWSKPLYILSHSKQILREAIKRDASFLERNDVMDYSLLVGLNSDDKLLVLGIIDYIRTYTLDKRIESIVKKTGILGGQGKLPTVLPPKLYKDRFSEAMERYFLAVPDRWEGLEKKN